MCIIHGPAGERIRLVVFHVLLPNLETVAQLCYMCSMCHDLECKDQATEPKRKPLSRLLLMDVLTLKMFAEAMRMKKRKNLLAWHESGRLCTVGRRRWGELFWREAEGHWNQFELMLGTEKTGIY
jgi:hypothetical protein